MVTGIGRYILLETAGHNGPLERVMLVRKWIIYVQYFFGFLHVNE